MNKYKVLGFLAFQILFIFQINAQNQDILFVNSIEGLRIRDNPGISANVIGHLKDLDKVTVIETDINPVEIDEIKDNWIKIQSGNITGWVFGGYLEDSIEKISNINRIAGAYYFSNYIDLKINNKLQDIKKSKSNNYYLDIKYKGNDVFIVIFHADYDQDRTVDYSKMIKFLQNNLYFVDFGGDSVKTSLYQEFSFNKDGNLIYHYYMETQSLDGENDNTSESRTVEYRANFKKR